MCKNLQFYNVILFCYDKASSNRELSGAAGGPSLFFHPARRSLIWNMTNARQARRAFLCLYVGHQPVVHFLAGGLGEGEDFFVFHLAFS